MGISSITDLWASTANHRRRSAMTCPTPWLSNPIRTARIID